MQPRGRAAAGAERAVSRADPVHSARRLRVRLGHAHGQGCVEGLVATQERHARGRESDHGVLAAGARQKAAPLELAHKVAQLAPAALAQDAVGRQGVEPTVQDLLRRGAPQDVDDGGDAGRGPSLRQARHAAHGLEGVLGHVALHELARAVPAVVAAGGGVLAKVAQDEVAQAVGRGAVERHLPQALLVALAKCGQLVGGKVVALGARHQVLGCVDVARHVEKDAFRRGAVATGAARLLVVGLQRQRHVVVDDEAHVRLVDPHAKRVGRDHHAAAVKQEVLLVAGALLGREARVVARGRDALLAKKLAGLLHGATARAVHDARASRALAAQCHQHPVALLSGLGTLDGKAEVGAVEAGHHAQGVVQPQRGGDVGADALGGRGGERHDRHACAQRVDEAADALVAGAEVVSPLRYAVRLVHGEKACPARVHRRDEPGVVQPLGRDVQKVQQPVAHLRKHGGALGAGLRAGEAVGGHARLAQRPHLVRHERDQGRHDHGHARQHDGGHLVADRLSRRRGHDGEHVAPGQRGAHDPLLVGAELAVAEGPPQNPDRVRVRLPRNLCHAPATPSVGRTELQLTSPIGQEIAILCTL